MILYSLLSLNFLCLSVFSLYANNGKNKRNFFVLIWSAISIFLLWFITAFRSINIGNDTGGYVRIFTEIRDYGLQTNSRIEIGFKVLCLGIAKITPDPHAFIIIISSLFYGLASLYIFKGSKNIAFSTVLLYALCFSLFISMIRQCLAMIIVMFAYNMIKRDKIFVPIVLILLASLFHITAIVSLLLLFSRFIKAPSKFLVLAFVSIFALVNLLGITATAVTSILNQMSLTYYEHYFSTSYASGGVLAVSYELARSVCVLLVCYSVYKNCNKKTEGNLAIYCAILMCVFCAFGYLLNLSTRISEYFLLIMVVELPNAFEKWDSKYKSALMISLCILFIAYFTTVLILRPEWNHLYPYEFWE